MSSIKISELPAFTRINANTSNTLFVGVDIPSAQTFQFTAHTLAQGLYSNETLSVGVNPNTLPNTIAQFALSGASYIQTNLVNTDDGGTADIVITANVGSGGTDAAYFTDLGFANKNVQPGLEFNNLGTALSPLDGYLYVQGSTVGGTGSTNGGNLIIGTTTTNTQIKFIAGGYNKENIVAIITGDGIKLTNGHPIYFTDGTSQNTSAASFAYSNASFAQANSASSNTIALTGVNLTQNTWIASNSVYSQAAFVQANSASSNTISIQGVDLTQNTWIASNAVFSQAAFAQANTASANTISLTGVNLTQNTWIASNSAFTQSAFNQANTASSNTIAIQGVDNTQNTWIASNAVFSQAAFNLANTSVQNTAIIQLQSLTLTGNLIANTVGQSVFIDNFISNTASFNKNLVVLGTLSANTLLGNVFFSNITTITTQSNSILWTTQSTTPAQQVAQLWYYGNTQSLILDTDVANDRLSISKVLFFRGYNSTGVTIPSNSIIRLVSGVTANQIPYIALADATNSANATVAGFVKNAIANGAYGFAYSQGIVEDLNTTGLGQNGDILFLSTTPGIASNVAPQTGNSNTVVQLGRVILSDATQGKLFIQNQLRQAYGRTNGSLLYAFANNITSSSTINVNDATGTVNANTIIANTFVYGSATANAMVTQLTSKSTSVTANGMSGQITMHNAALAGQGYVSFTVNNSSVLHVNDIPFVAVQNSITTPNPYIVSVGKVAVGSFNITLYNADSGGGSSHSDAVVLNWGLIRVGN
jgi:hypothetical protein